MSFVVRAGGRLGRLVLIAVIGGLVMALGLYALGPAVAGVTGAGKSHAQPIPALDELDEPSIVYAGDGSVLDVFRAEINRKPVTLEEVPLVVQNAVIDVEDRNFYSHEGFDVRSIARAFVANSGSDGIVQGGSTITQQLVKNALLNSKKELDRKINEVVLARRVEDTMSKHDILERYLNTVYFGNSAYGVGAAAETYFNHPVGQLTLPEAALLAGMIRCPSGCEPTRNPKTAQARRTTVLEEMESAGHITAADKAAAQATPLPTNVHAAAAPAKGTYFVEEVRKTLLADKRLGDTEEDRERVLYRGGLKIYTTLDPKLQAMAQESVAQNLPDTKGKYDAALVTVEPSTGRVVAMVGGPGFDQYQYNEATQAYRSPGSSFKPIVLLTALENGYGPTTVVDGSAPCNISAKGFGKPHAFNNSEGHGGGFEDLTSATAASVNCAYLRLSTAVGLDKVTAMAHRLGFPSTGSRAFVPLLSMAIGTEEATPLQMASAYTVIPNDGVRHNPTYIDRVLNRDGSVLFQGVDQGTRVVSPTTARLAAQIMQSVITRGTASRNGRVPGHMVAGKTGTASNNKDAWFVGFSAQYVTAVWMGDHRGDSDANRIVVAGRTVFGGDYPTKIWSSFMIKALADKPNVPFLDPDKKSIPKGKSINSTGTVSNSVPPRKPTGPTTTKPGGGTGPTTPGSPTTKPDNPVTPTTKKQGSPPTSGP